MNYEKFKRSDRPDRFRSLTTVNDFLSVVGEKFFNDYLNGYILMTIGSGFLFWNQNFCLQIKK
jgi:hypothetical protein